MVHHTSVPRTPHRLRPHLTELGIDVSTGTVDDALDMGRFHTPPTMTSAAWSSVLPRLGRPDDRLERRSSWHQLEPFALSLKISLVRWLLVAGA
jgi:hypothetical protein